MNSLKRKIVIGTAVSALTLGGLGFATTNAMADVEPEGKSISITAAGGKATFNQETHGFWVKDTKNDGKAVRAVAVWNGGDSDFSVAASGKGDKGGATLNITDGTKIKIKLCYTKGGKTLECSKPQSGVA